MRQTIQHACKTIVLILLPTLAWSEPLTFRVGTGSDTGLYWRFTQYLAEEIESIDAEIEIIPVSTGGSVQNFELMRDGEINLALVQSDIAYDVYEGIGQSVRFNDFRLGLLLFPEYLQIIVRADSDIRVLGDLQQLNISVGPSGSGSYRTGLRLLRNLGLRPGVDYFLMELSPSDGVAALSSQELDAMIYVGGDLPAGNDVDWNALSVFSLSRPVINNLVAQSPYLVPMSKDFVLTSGGTTETVAVTALLVASNDVNPDDLERLIRAMSRLGVNFQDLGDSTFTIHEPQDAIRLAPIPLHQGLRNYLVGEGHLEPNYFLPLIVSSAIAFVLLILYSQSRVNAYDRLGNVRGTDGFWGFKIFDAIARMGTIAIAAVFFLLSLVLLAEVMEYVETDYARETNIENAFAEMRFRDTLFWIFRFMGAGDPGDVFPASPIGRGLAMILPFLGVGAVLGVGFLWADKHRSRLAEQQRGTLLKKLKGHILICGWNNKVKDIIFGLTHINAPERKKVVVVAEIDGDMPLADYKFDARLVSYCRGDSADHSVLSKANVQEADAAIVVAGQKKKAGRNIGSVLSVMALKESYAKGPRGSAPTGGELFVAAELLYEENRPFFNVCGVDAVVATEQMANNLIANSALSPLVTDFVLDMLTFDDYSEIYTASVDQILNPGRLHQQRFLKSLFPVNSHTDVVEPNGFTLTDAKARLAEHGINVLALATNANARHGGIEHDFTSGDYTLVFDEDAQTTPVNLGDHIVFVANDFADIRSASSVLQKEENGSPYAQVANEDISLPKQPTTRIILAGNAKRCLAVEKLMRCIPWARVSILTESAPEDVDPDVSLVTGPFSSEASWNAVGIESADQLTIVAETHEGASDSNSAVSQAGADARAILIARLGREFRARKNDNKSNTGLSISAEMFELSSRALFHDAGVDHVIPTNLVAERLLITLIFGKGIVSRFLMGLLTLCDGKHLFGFTLDEQFTHLVGKTFDELAINLPGGCQLVAIHPTDEKLRNHYTNKVGDFKFHFLTDNRPIKIKRNRKLFSEERKYKSKLGDELIVILNRNQAYS